MRQRRSLKRALLVLLCASLLQIVSWLPLVGPIPTASAHAFVIGSSPIDGSTISQPPALVRIYFDAPLAALSRASVYAFPPGAPANGLLVNAGQSTINPTNVNELDTALLPAGQLPQGSYEVRWTALSLTDGHTTSGLIGFNLGLSSVGLSGTPLLGPSTSNYFPQLTLQGGLSTAWDWLVLLALFFWIGILLTDYLLLPRSAPEAFLVQARKYARSLQPLCLLALLLGEGITLVLRATAFTQTSGQSGINPDTLAQLMLNTNYGHFWLARIGLLLLALLFHWLGASHQGPSQNAPGAPTTSKGGKRFAQLRQQALQELAVTPTAPALTHSQARVTGAVAANLSSARGTTGPLPKITVDFGQEEDFTSAYSLQQMIVGLVLAGLILLTLVLSNEVIQLAPLPVSAGVLDWLALVAQAAWFGPLAYLGLTLLPALPATDPDHHAETLLVLLKRARSLVLAAIGVLLVSEIFLSEATLQVPGQLLSDPYGRALLVRASLLLLMLALTGYTLLVLLPRLQRQTVLLPVVNAGMPARRTRRFEIDRTERTVKRGLQGFSGLAAATLFCLALMNFFAPPVAFPNVDYQALVNQSTAHDNTPTPITATQQAGNLSVTLTVTPARVGVDNTLTLTLTDATGQAITDATVKLSINMQVMDMGTATATVNGGNSTYAATFKADQTFSMGGTWNVHVEIERQGHLPVQLTFPVSIAQ